MKEDKLSRLNTVGKRIEFLRQQKGIKQEDLAKKVDVSRRTVYAWEANEKRPREKHLKLAADVLGVPVELLSPETEVGDHIKDYVELHDDARAFAQELVRSVMTMYGHPEIDASRDLQLYWGVTITEVDDKYIFFKGTDDSFESQYIITAQALSRFYEELIDYVMMRMNQQTGKDMSYLRLRKVMTDDLYKTRNPENK